MAVRPTSEEIDCGIVEAAAGLFARHGYERTSLQQVADAAGYSKTGLLHRFPSKAALHAAVVAAITAEMEALVAGLDEHPAGRRARRGLELLTAAALRRPTMVRFFLAAYGVGAQGAGCSPLQALGDRLVAALGAADAEPEQRLRLQLSLAVVAHAAADPHPELGERLEPFVVDVASAVLGPGG